MLNNGVVVVVLFARGVGFREKYKFGFGGAS